MSDIAEKVAHTKGPWMVEPHSDRDESVSVVADYQVLADGVKQAHWIAECDSGADSEMSSDEYEVALETMEANARLIAAAPDLLAACKGVFEWCQCDPDINPNWLRAWNAMLAAIKRAEG